MRAILPFLPRDEKKNGWQDSDNISQVLQRKKENQRRSIETLVKKISFEAHHEGGNWTEEKPGTLSYWKEKT